MFVMDSTTERFCRVQELAAVGMSDYKIAARTGINRSTVQRWRHRELPPFAHITDPWDVSDPVAYSYLLGVRVTQSNHRTFPSRIGRAWRLWSGS